MSNAPADLPDDSEWRDAVVEATTALLYRRGYTSLGRRITGAAHDRYTRLISRLPDSAFLHADYDPGADLQLAYKFSPNSERLPAKAASAPKPLLPIDAASGSRGSWAHLSTLQSNTKLRKQHLKQVKDILAGKGKQEARIRKALAYINEHNVPKAGDSQIAQKVGDAYWFPAEVLIMDIYNGGQAPILSDVVKLLDVIGVYTDEDNTEILESYRCVGDIIAAAISDARTWKVAETSEDVDPDTDAPYIIFKTKVGTTVQACIEQRAGEYIIALDSSFMLAQTGEEVPLSAIISDDIALLQHEGESAMTTAQYRANIIVDALSGISLDADVESWPTYLTATDDETHNVTTSKIQLFMNACLEGMLKHPTSVDAAFVGAHYGLDVIIGSIHVEIA